MLHALKENMAELNPSGCNLRSWNGTSKCLTGNHLLSSLQDPTRHQIETALFKNIPLGLILLIVVDFYSLQRVYGEEISARLLDAAERATKETAQSILGSSALLLVDTIEPAGFTILFDKRSLDLDDLPDRAMSLKLSVRNILNREVVKLTGQRVEIRCGYALVTRNGRIDIERILYDSLCDARVTAEQRFDLGKLKLLHEFREIIAHPRLRAVYQPIMDFRSGGLVGWEALTRGPEGSYFQSPMALFDFAEEAGLLFPLEKACREQAIRQLGEFSHDHKLFLNIHPRTLTDPAFSPGETLDLLHAHGLNPQNIVFEITERHSISEFTLFHRTLDHYRKQGYLVAIDDVGTGYSGLSSIADIRPDFIKVDMSLIRGIDSNPVKRALIETLVAFADKIGCGVIAEGIETETEMSCLISMGVHCGQGYFIAVPDFPKPAPTLSIPAHIMFKNRHRGEWKCSIPVSELAEPAHRVSPDVEVQEVKRMLEAEPPISGVVVTDGEKPIGLIMSHHLDRQLGTRYGIALYYRRSITHVMDSAALIVEGETPVEVVAKLAMKRETFKIYDHIIVTRNGGLLGIISVQKMLDTLARVQVEMAKGANPLTGLAGNLAIEQEIAQRSRLGSPTSLIYVDLDHFKIYNDHYGFKDGDRVILLLSHILAWAVRRHGEADDFVGHVGGDDFVLITHPERSERIAQAVVRCFKRLIKQCYSVEDRTRGFICGKDRNGREGEFPLVSVSLAIVDCWRECDFDHVERRAAEMKRYAKTIRGNKYVRDRRTEI